MMEDNFDGVSMIDLIRKDEAMQIKDAFVVQIHVFVLPFIHFHGSAPSLLRRQRNSFVSCL